MAKTVVDYLREDIQELRSDIKIMSEKIDQLNSFRWKFAGGMAVVCFLVTAVFQIASIFLKP